MSSAKPRSRSDSFYTLLVYLTALLFVLAAPAITQAQLVADGETNILDSVTANVTGGITIGTNGSFTLLMLTNGAIVTSLGQTVIGTNATANSNLLVVTSPGSRWDILSNGLTVGDFGSYNQLQILDGGAVSNRSVDFSSYSYIGKNPPSRSNLVLVSGLGSKWTPAGVTIGGAFGGSSFNQLMISNGGTVVTVVNGCGIGCSNNTVIVTGSGSRLATDYLTVGGSISSFNRLIVTNGASVKTQDLQDQGSNIGNYGLSNLVIVTGAGSTWTNAHTIQIGTGQEGYGNALIVSNGGAVVTESTKISDTEASHNFVVVSGTNSALLNSADFYINFYGRSSNALLVADGGKVANNTGYIGYGNNSYYTGDRAVVSGANSLWTNRTSLYVGYATVRNQLVITNGGVVADFDGYVASRQYAYVSSYSNQVMVTGAGSRWNNRNNLYLDADGGWNQMIISNAAVVVNGNGYFGYSQSGGSNVVIVSGAGTLWSNRLNLYVGYSNQFNQLLITNGAQVVCQSGRVGTDGFGSKLSNNLVVVTGPGSEWRTSGSLQLDGSVGNRLMISNSGTVSAQSLITGGSPMSGKAITVAGGSLIVTNSASISSATLSAGLIQATKLFVSLANDLVFNGGTLQVRDAAFSDNAPFSFGNGGGLATYEMQNAGTNAFAGGLVVSSNALLTGNGTVSGNVAVAAGGTISPGDSAGQITIKGSLVLSNGSITALKLDAGAGTCDQLAIATNVTYGGRLQLTNFPGDLTNGSSFQLFSAKSYAGAFNSLVPSSPGPGLKWNTNELSVDGVLRVFAINPPSPNIINPVFSGGDLVFTAMGGVPYDPCYELSSTNIVSPLTDWEFWATNYFDASGLVTFTNSMSSGKSERYFLLLVE